MILPLSIDCHPFLHITPFYMLREMLNFVLFLYFTVHIWSSPLPSFLPFVISPCLILSAYIVIGYDLFSHNRDPLAHLHTWLVMSFLCNENIFQRLNKSIKIHENDPSLAPMALKKFKRNIYIWGWSHFSYSSPREFIDKCTKSIYVFVCEHELLQ